MILAKDGNLAGHPVRDVQAALQTIRRRPFQTREGFVRQEKRARHRRGRTEAKAADEAAGELWDALVARRLLVKSPQGPAGEAFQLSKRALAICNATIGTSYTRQAAKQALDVFVERCRQLDSRTSIYPYRVQTAVLFGSYAAGRQTVGDVDVLVKLEQRARTWEGHERAVTSFVSHMQRQGRSIPWDALSFWPYQQTLVFLRGRSRILALVSQFDDAHLKLAVPGPHQLLHGWLPSGFAVRQNKMQQEGQVARLGTD